MRRRSKLFGGILPTNPRYRVAGGVLTFFLLFYLFCVHYIEPHEVAITWNRFSGELRLDRRAGFHLTAPWVQAARIDTRPIRVCLTSTGRSFNCKLVQFVPAAYREFIAVQGFHYFWFSNRLSFNAGYEEEYRGMKDLLRGYAYSVQPYPFVVVRDEYVHN